MVPENVYQVASEYMRKMIATQLKETRQLKRKYTGKRMFGWRYYKEDIFDAEGLRKPVKRREMGNYVDS